MGAGQQGGFSEPEPEFECAEIGGFQSAGGGEQVYAGMPYVPFSEEVMGMPDPNFGGNYDYNSPDGYAMEEQPAPAWDVCWDFDHTASSNWKSKKWSKQSWSNNKNWDQGWSAPMDPMGGMYPSPDGPFSGDFSAEGYAAPMQYHDGNYGGEYEGYDGGGEEVDYETIPIEGAADGSIP